MSAYVPESNVRSIWRTFTPLGWVVIILAVLAVEVSAIWSIDVLSIWWNLQKG